MTLTTGDIIGIVSGILTLLLGVIGFLLRHSFESEKLLLIRMSEQNAADVRELRAKHEKLDAIQQEHTRLHERFAGQFKAIQSDVDRLDNEDGRQDHELRKLKERLDKGARTISQQVEAVHEEDSDPPPPPRRRLQSRS